MEHLWSALKTQATAAELALADVHTRDDMARLTFLALYHCYRVLGYLPRKQDIPSELVAHLRWYLQLDETVACTAASRSRRRYAEAIRTALGVTPDITKAIEVARKAMDQAEQTMDHPADLINAALESLVQASWSCQRLAHWIASRARSAPPSMIGGVRRSWVD